MIKRKCIHCDNEYISHHKKQKYCSHKCYVEADVKKRIGIKHHRFLGSKIKICEQCGKEFEISIRKLNRDEGGFCSLACWHLFNKREHNVIWKGGLTPFRQTCTESIEWSILYKEILKNFNYQCFLCNKNYAGRDKMMEIHHLRNITQYWWLFFDKHNLIFLCKDCHNWIHSKKNKYNFLKEDWKMET